MLGAVTFGHESFQPVIQAIIELAEHAAKDPWPLSEPSAEEQALKARVDALARAGLTEAYREPDKGARHDKVDAVRAALAEALTAEGLDAEKAKSCLPRPGSRGRPQRHPRHRHAHRRPRHQDGAADRRRGRRPAACARLRAVHPRRDAGALRRHARHRAGRADHRRARGRVPRALHAALQLPALFGGRGRPHGLAGPPRGGPWQAGLARDPSAAAGEGEVPLHAARRLRDHRKQRHLLDGDGVRQLARADGRRRAAEAAGGRHRHGADQGGPRLRRAVRHPG